MYLKSSFMWASSSPISAHGVVLLLVGVGLLMALCADESSALALRGFDDYQLNSMTAATSAETTSTKSSNTQVQAIHSRRRRTVQDVVTIEQLDAARRYVPESSFARSVNVDTKGDFFPTTRAQDVVFFQVSDANAAIQTASIGENITVNSCLAFATSHRCVDADCTELTRNDVPQKIYSWQPQEQAWTDNGPGAGNLNDAGVIVGDGITSLSHFSPDGVQDMIIPAAFSSDPTTITPTQQCAVVWRYQSASEGYHKYQDCEWQTHGARHAEVFRINGELLLLQTNMVKRTYLLGNLVGEQYTGVPNFILKWSDRTIDNHGNSKPHGFFLTGGEYSGGKLLPGDTGYTTTAGNNGSNVWQTFDDLSGVVHATSFEIRGETFIAFSEYVSDSACESVNADVEFPSCWNVELNSHIYKFDERIANPRGDCISSNSPEGCQYFEGEFTPYQTLPTNGARSMVAFAVTTTGNVEHFLAVAESHDNTLQSTKSSIYKWNGHRFGLFQQLDTTFAEDVEFFELDGQAHLAITNRGCVPLERNSSFAQCGSQDSTDLGRTQVYFYNIFLDAFELVKESEAIGELHALSSFENDNGDLVLQGGGQGPVGLAVFQLPVFDVFRFTTTATYIAVANERILQTNKIGTCPNDSPALCSNPENLFQITASVTAGIASSVTTLSEASLETDLKLDSLSAQVDGGDLTAASLTREFGLDLRLYGASAVQEMKLNGEQFLIVGFEEAFMTPNECVSYYANLSSPEYRCHHNAAATPLASEAQCFATCADGSYEPTIPHFETETIVFKVDRSSVRPQLREIQRLPSFSVSDLHIFTLSANMSQETYEHCAAQMNPADCLFGQNTNQTSGWDGKKILAIVNKQSTCELDLDGSTSAAPPPDPTRHIVLYSFDEFAQRFVRQSQIESVCQPSGMTSFQTACQRVAGAFIDPPICSQYLAVAEDCSSYNTFLEEAGADMTLAIPGGQRVAFYKSHHPESLSFQHCQPYADPGDLRNKAESPCYQPNDPFRDPNIVSPGDTHTFDFPDLLPVSAEIGIDLSEDGFGYFPQLRDAQIMKVVVGTPQGQKSVFYPETTPSDSLDEVADYDSLARSAYWVNGRKRYELTLTVIFNEYRAAPQVFGLRMLHPRSTACSQRHATTPVRRMFTLVQSIRPTSTSGGRDAITFERLAADGSFRTYTVFAEEYRRGLTSGEFTKGLLSSVYVDDTCDEYAQYTYSETVSEGIDAAGIFEPQPDILSGVSLPDGDTRWCPYSTNVSHFLAWEAFENHYNPVSPCKGKSYDPDRNLVGIELNFYNRLPPASLRGSLSQTAVGTTIGGFEYPALPEHASIISTHRFAAAEYQDLFYRKDEPISKLQDLSTYQATSVAAHQLCGTGSQFWLIFGQGGWDMELNEDGRPIAGDSAPQQKRYLFRWNDKFAVDSDGVSCTASAARAEIALRGAYGARLGCFETILLEVPSNGGAVSGVTLMSINGWLLLLKINKHQGTQTSLSSTSCSSSGALTQLNVTGVLSYSLTTDLSASGGSVCQAFFQEEAAAFERYVLESSILQAAEDTQAAIDELKTLAASLAINTTELDNRYVTLDSDQEITGTKTFVDVSATSLYIEEDLAVSGELDVTGKVSISGDVDVFGLIDGVDLSVFQEQVLTEAEDSAQTILKLQADSCTAVAIASGESIVCAGVTKPTSCLPKASLKENGLLALYAALQVAASYSLNQSDVSASVDSARMNVGSPNGYLVLKAADDATLLEAINNVNVTTFYNSLYCEPASTISQPVASAGYTFLTFPIRFLLIPCNQWDQAPVNDLIVALVAQLSRFAVRLADIIATQVTCNDDSSSTLNLRITAASDFQSNITQAFGTLNVWNQVYFDLIDTRPSMFAAVLEVVEFVSDKFAPSYLRDDDLMSSGDL